MNVSRTERVKAQRRLLRRRRLRLALFVFFAATLLATLTLWLSDLLAERTVRHAPPNLPLDQPLTTNPPEERVLLTFVGDVMMAGRVGTLLEEKGYDYPYLHVRELFLSDDYTAANLETPVTTHGTPERKAYVYKSAPQAIPALKEAGVDLVNLANNHSMDQGENGLIDTFRVLEENDIAYVGAGRDESRAYAPVYVERKGMKIAFLGFSRVIPHVGWYAGKNKPGVAATYDPAKALEAIRSAGQIADLVVVIAHWGEERADYPVDYQKQLAHAYIDAGAHLVIGSHPHVLQGLERYRNGWIAYSLGNFIFTRSTHAQTWETVILQASCSKSAQCELTLLPFYTELGRPVPLNATDGAKLLKRVESISFNVRISPDGKAKAVAED